MRWRNIIVTGALIISSTVTVFANTEEVDTSNINKNVMLNTTKNIDLMYKYEWEQYKNSKEYKL